MEVAPTETEEAKEELSTEASEATEAEAEKPTEESKGGKAKMTKEERKRLIQDKLAAKK